MRSFGPVALLSCDCGLFVKLHTHRPFDLSSLIITVITNYFCNAIMVCTVPVDHVFIS